MADTGDGGVFIMYEYELIRRARVAGGSTWLVPGSAPRVSMAVWPIRVRANPLPQMTS